MKKKLIILSTIAATLVAFAVVLFTVIIPNIKNKSSTPITPIENAEIGDYIRFGKYEQDGYAENGTEEIEWLVLDKKNDKLLVISKYALFQGKYNKYYDTCVWENCSLSEYLNTNFIWDAFMEYEQNVISLSTVTADKNPDYSNSYGDDQGKNVEDYVFLLSIKEINKYLSDNKSRKCIATDYAISQGVSNKNGECCWWLRTMGDSFKSASYVGFDGSVFTYGDKVDETSYAVRPAMWIDVNAYVQLEADYNNAQELVKNEKYEEALAIYKKLIDYKESVQKVELCEELIKAKKYNDALSLMKENSYNDAAELFNTISGYKDSDELKATCKEMHKSKEYSKAVELINAGNYDEAYKILSYIVDYENSRELIDECKKYKTKQAVLSSKEGNYITIGTFEQDYFTKEKEPLKWQIIDIKDGKALVVSKEAIYVMEDVCGNMTYSWANSEVRKWLNDTFLRETFTDGERLLIEKTNVPLDKSNYANQGEETTDKIFLLSRSEVEEYFDTLDDAECILSKQAMHLWGAPDRELDYWVVADWTLRSVTANNKFEVVYCNDPTNKRIGEQSKYDTYSIVRPAMWIDLSV